MAFAKGKIMEQGTNLGSYMLPVNDTQKVKRNFPGYEKRTVYSLEDLKKGDSSGTTETDSATNSPDPGYTDINKKK